MTIVNDSNSFVEIHLKIHLMSNYVLPDNYLNHNVIVSLLSFIIIYE